MSHPASLLRDRNPPLTTSARIAGLAWIACGSVAAFTVENLWLDGWLRRRFHRIPPLVPEPLGGTWALALAVLAIVLVFAAVCQIILFRDRAFPAWRKVLGGVSLFLAALLCAAWLMVTSGSDLTVARMLQFNLRSVTLQWNASTSLVAGYNVYRADDRKGEYRRINKALVKGLIYIDKNAESGHKYFYVARAVNYQGKESVDSNISEIDVP